jgi:hypothetical protein
VTSEDRHQPFESFRVTTEVMPDGRRVHYYEWPAGPRDRPPAGFEGAAATSGWPERSDNAAWTTYPESQPAEDV